jgi:hypothetical protein
MSGDVADTSGRAQVDASGDIGTRNKKKKKWRGKEERDRGKNDISLLLSLL